jgi:hypothetical protein
MQTRGIATAFLALGTTTLLLTGCAQQSTDHVEKKPSTSATPSASATPADEYSPAPYDNACDGKQAVISDTAGSQAIEDCEAVAVVSKGSEIVVGTAKSMVVEGSNNDITVASLESLTLLGSNNKVHVAGSAPDVDDQGTGNTVD